MPAVTVAGLMDGSLRISSRLPNVDAPPRRNLTVSTARVTSAGIAGSRPMSTISLPKQPLPIVQPPLFGMNVSRASGTPTPLANIILRPGQTEIDGARPDGDAGEAAAPAAISALGSV